jgi:hypothetical protein
METLSTSLKVFKDQYIGSKHDIIDLLQIQSVIHITICSSLILFKTNPKIYLVCPPKFNLHCCHKNYHYLPLDQTQKKLSLPHLKQHLPVAISPFHFKNNFVINCWFLQREQ